MAQQAVPALRKVAFDQFRVAEQNVVWLVRDALHRVIVQTIQHVGQFGRTRSIS
jgi:hypothetical protein